METRIGELEHLLYKKGQSKETLKWKQDLEMLVMVNQYEEKDNCKRAKRDFEKLRENLGKPINQNNFLAFPYHIF